MSNLQNFVANNKEFKKNFKNGDKVHLVHRLAIASLACQDRTTAEIVTHIVGGSTEVVVSVHKIQSKTPTVRRSRRSLRSHFT